MDEITIGKWGFAAVCCCWFLIGCYFGIWITERVRKNEREQ